MKKGFKIFLLSIFALAVLSAGLGKMAEAQARYPYMIKVNRQQCVVTIYEMDKNGNYTVPIKAMLCSPGYDTPIGTFKTPQKYRWHLLMNDVWGQYCTRINKGILFHSVWYYEKDPSTMSNRQFNNLGTMCSHGCVRLTAEDAKWIYDNCPLGTTVTIYDSKDPGPLGKPEPIKVSTATVMGYDPTDIWSEGNPYIIKTPTISGVKDKTFTYGQKIDLLSGVKAYSATGSDITKKISTSIKFLGKPVKKVDSKTAGKYYVTYSVADKLGKKTEAEAVITVKDTVKPKITGAKNLYLEEGGRVTEALAKKNVKAKWHSDDITSSLKVSIKKEKSTDTLTSYLLTYQVKAPNGQKAVKTKYAYIDTEAPAFKGATDRNIAVDDVVDEEFALEGIDVEDNSGLVTKEAIKTSIIREDDTHYKVTYTVKDKNKNETVAEAVFTITNFIHFEGVKDRLIKKGTELDNSFLMEGVKAYDQDEDITDRVQIGVTDLGDGEYRISYTAIDEKGQSKTVEAYFTEE